MKVRTHKTEPQGIRPGTARVCILDARDNHECWFDASEPYEHIRLSAYQWDLDTQTVFFRFPEEADNGRRGAWVRYDDISERELWVCEAMVNVAAVEVAKWASKQPEPLPGPLARLVAAVAEANAASAATTR